MADNSYPQFGPEAMAQIDEYDLWLDKRTQRSPAIAYLASKPYLCGGISGAMTGVLIAISAFYGGWIAATCALCAMLNGCILGAVYSDMNETH